MPLGSAIWRMKTRTAAVRALQKPLYSSNDSGPLRYLTYDIDLHVVDEQSSAPQVARVARRDHRR